MKKLKLIISLMLLYAGYIQAQTGTVSGKVTDTDGNPLISANVVVKNTSTGSSTGSDGSFTLSNIKIGTQILVASYLGYEDMELTIDVKEGQTATANFSLKEGIFLGNEVVISGARVAEKITEAPATIGVISSQNIANNASFNYGELLGKVKGVEYFRAGVVNAGINVRGFNNTFNSKMLQMNDNRISNLIATGLPYGPLSPTIKEDIERIEVVLGPTAALFGPNAHSGLVNTISKDPRSSAGTTVALGVGNQSVLTGRLRHAQVINDKFAFKVTGEYTKGEEFEYTDSVYLAPGLQPAKEELDLDRDFNFLRGEASLYYSPTSSSDIIFTYGGSNSNFLSVTNAGRNQIKDWKINYYQLKYVSQNIFANVYYTTSSTDDTYNINQRTKNYWSYRNAGFDDATARLYYKNKFYAGGNPEDGIDRGTQFIDRSRRINAEVQYNNNWGNLGLVTGAQYQLDMANSEQTYLLDGDGSIDLTQFGFYAQADYKWDNGFKILLAARADNHERYGFNFVPKAGLLKIGDNGTWRLTYGLGIASPTILHQDLDLFGHIALGNGEGFTLSNGNTIDPLKVERLQTIELGYKGNFNRKLYLDANAFFNIAKDFISPLTPLYNLVNPADPATWILVTERGGKPIADFGSNGIVLSYVNFGKVNTYGVDLGINYYFTDQYSIGLNYSYFDYIFDTDDPDNDFDGDGEVKETDLLVNAPKNKLNASFTATPGKFFGTVLVRWVEKYDFFSGKNVAASTNADLTWSGFPVVEDAVVASDWNYGPLGGFVNVDINLGYRLNDYFTVSASVNNVFDSEIREMVASPFNSRLYALELKVNLPAIGSK